MNTNRRVFLVTALATGLGGSFALGRASRPAPAVRAPAASAQPAGPPERSGSRPHASIPRLAALPATPAAECEQVDRRATAASLVEGVLRRLPGRRMGGSDDSAEGGANAVRPYLQGVADAVRQSAPSVKAAFTDEFTERLCRGSLKDDELITMAYLGLEMPEITGPRAFDCVFSRRGNQEDAVLWYMLDAWRHSGQERSTAIAQIQRTATDPRTQRRFLTREQELSMRAGDRLAPSR